jgi:hypothetical protein
MNRPYYLLVAYVMQWKNKLDAASIASIGQRGIPRYVP